MYGAQHASEDVSPKSGKCFHQNDNRFFCQIYVVSHQPKKSVWKIVSEKEQQMPRSEESGEAQSLISLCPHKSFCSHSNDAELTQTSPKRGRLAKLGVRALTLEPCEQTHLQNVDFLVCIYVKSCVQMDARTFNTS